MKIEDQIKQIIVDAFAKNNLVLDSEVEVTGSKDKSHGDFASNVCLKNAKKFNMKPFELGKLIADSINDPAINKVEYCFWKISFVSILRHKLHNIEVTFW